MTLTEAVRIFVSREQGEQRLSDSELGRRSGLGQPWVNRFLNSRRGTLGIDRAEALARGLGMRLDQLLAAADAIRREDGSH